MLSNSQVSFVNSYSVLLGFLYLETLPEYKTSKWYDLFLREITFFVFLWIVQLVTSHFFLFTAMFIDMKKLILTLIAGWLGKKYLSW